MTPSLLDNHPKCECHQCTWLRANQFERVAMPQQPTPSPFDRVGVNPAVLGPSPEKEQSCNDPKRHGCGLPPKDAAVEEKIKELSEKWNLVYAGIEMLRDLVRMARESK